MEEKKQKNTPIVFKIGDSVCLKTGEGPLMQIEDFKRNEETKLIDTNQAICKWTKRGKTYRKTFHISLLMHDGPFFTSTAIDSVE